jgi:hypothetical protein
LAAWDDKFQKLRKPIHKLEDLKKAMVDSSDDSSGDSDDDDDDE